MENQLFTRTCIIIKFDSVKVADIFWRYWQYHTVKVSGKNLDYTEAYIGMGINEKLKEPVSQKGTGNDSITGKTIFWYMLSDDIRHYFLRQYITIFLLSLWEAFKSSAPRRTLGDSGTFQNKILTNLERGSLTWGRCRNDYERTVWTIEAWERHWRVTQGRGIWLAKSAI